MSRNDNIYLTGEADEDIKASFIEAMETLIARSKAVTADMEALLAELDSAVAPFL